MKFVKDEDRADMWLRIFEAIRPTVTSTTIAIKGTNEAYKAMEKGIET